MNNKNLEIISKKLLEKESDSTTISIGNSLALEIFGINNENINFFESVLPVKVYQKGNQIEIKGDKKFRNILKNTITKTIKEIKFSENNVERNLILENLKMHFLNNSENIKSFTVIKTNKCDVVGKSKRQNDYLEILQKKQIIFAIGPAGTGKTFLAVAAAVLSY